MDNDQIKRINHSITRFLARREHSYFELVQKLTMRDFDLTLIKQQLGLFVDGDIQSDERFAHSVVRSAYMNGKGPQHVSQKLQQHQINESLFTEYLWDDEFDWDEKAREVRIKKFGELLPSDFAAKQKQMRFLQYRGFDMAQIKSALK